MWWGSEGVIPVSFMRCNDISSGRLRLSICDADFGVFANSFHTSCGNFHPPIADAFCEVCLSRPGVRTVRLYWKHDGARRWSSIPPVRACRYSSTTEISLTKIYRSTSPIVKLGLTVTTSSPTLDLSSSSPFYLIIVARILTTPRPQSPITLATHLNALDSLGNRSFNNIVCVSPETKNQKRIEIWPRGWPQYIWDADNLRDSWSFVTVPVNGELKVRHQVDVAKIMEARLKAGERYQASLTDNCLGTRWWAFGSLDEFDGVRFRQWSKREEGEGTDNEGRYLMGEVPDDLAFVIEGGTVEFEIEQTVE